MTDYLSIRAAARYLGTHSQRVYRLIEAGALPEPVDLVVNGNRVRGIPRTALDAVPIDLIQPKHKPHKPRRASDLRKPRNTSQIVEFDYINHEDKFRRVRVAASTVRAHVGPTEHYPDDSAKIAAWDVDRKAWRVYKLAHVVEWHDVTTAR